MNYHSILSTITLSLLFINTPIYAMIFDTPSNFLSNLASSVKEHAITIWCGQKSLAEIKDESYIISERICISLCNLSKIQQSIKYPNQNTTPSAINELKNNVYTTEIKNLNTRIDAFKEYIKTYDTSIKNRDSERIQNLDTVQKYITTADVKHIDIEKLRSYIYKVTTITNFRVDKIDKKEPLDNSTIEPFENYIKQNELAIENNIENIDTKKTLNESTLILKDQEQTPCININTNNTNKPNNSNNQEKTIEYQPAEQIAYINKQEWNDDIKIYCLQLLWIQNKNNSYDSRKLFTDALQTYQSSPPYMVHKNYKKPAKYQFFISTATFETSFNNINCNDELFKSFKKLFNTQIKNIENIKKIIKDIEEERKKSTSISIETWQQYLHALREYSTVIKDDKTSTITEIENKINEAIKNIQSVTEGIKNALLEKNIYKQKISINEWTDYFNALKIHLDATQDEKEKKELNKRIANVAKIIKRKKIKENIKPIREKIEKDKKTYEKSMLSVAETYLSQLIKLKKLTPKPTTKTIEKAAKAVKDIDETIKDIELKIAKRTEEKELEPLIDFYIKNTDPYSIAIFNDNINSDFNKLNSYEQNNLSSNVFKEQHLKAIENINYNLKRIKEINEKIKEHTLFIDKPNLNFHYFIDKVSELRILLPTEQLPYKSSLYDKLVSALKKMTANIKKATFLPIMSPMQLEEDLKESIDFFNEYKGIKKEDSNFICTILEEYKKDNYYTKLDSLIKKYENDDALLKSNEEELKNDLTALQDYKKKYEEATSKNIYSPATTFFKDYLGPIDKTIKKINQQIDMLLSIDQQNTTPNIIEKKNIEQEDTIQKKVPQSTEQDNPTENEIIKEQNAATEKDKTKNNIPTVEKQNTQQKSIVSQSTGQNKLGNTIIEDNKQPDNNIFTPNEQNSEQKEPAPITIDQSKTEEQSKDHSSLNNTHNSTEKPAPITIDQSTGQKEPKNNILIPNEENKKPVTNVVATNGQNGQKPTSSEEPEPKTPINQSSSWLSYIGSILYSPIGGLRYLFSSFLKLFRIF